MQSKFRDFKYSLQFKFMLVCTTCSPLKSLKYYYFNLPIYTNLPINEFVIVTLRNKQ